MQRPLPTPPAVSRETDPLLALQPPAVPRLALECLPMPIMIFEPSLRLNFVNSAARKFFGISEFLKKPEAAFLGADEFFAGDNLRLGPPTPEQLEAMAFRGESVEFGDWGEELRSFSCRRRIAGARQGQESHSLILVRASVASFQPSQDYFAAGPHHTSTASHTRRGVSSPSPHSPSLSMSGPWHIVTLLGSIVSPSDSNNETLGALTPLNENSSRPGINAMQKQSSKQNSASSQSSEASGRASVGGQFIESPFAQFSAMADSRAPPLLLPGAMGRANKSPSAASKSLPTPGSPRSVASSSASITGVVSQSPKFPPSASSLASPAPGISTTSDSFFPKSVRLPSSTSVASSSTGASSFNSGSAGTPASTLSSNTSASTGSPAGSALVAPVKPPSPEAMLKSSSSTFGSSHTYPSTLIPLTPAEKPGPPPRKDSPAAAIIAQQRAMEKQDPPLAPVPSASLPSLTSAQQRAADYVASTSAASYMSAAGKNRTNPGTPGTPVLTPPVSLRQAPAWSGVSSLSSIPGTKRPPLRPAGRARSSYTTSSGSIWSSPQSSSSSATAHPASTGMPSPDFVPALDMPASGNPLTLLTHAALAHLPNTGLLLASHDLSGGFVNDTARELLLGVRSPAQLAKAEDSENEESDEGGIQSGQSSGDWMEEGLWIASPEPGGKWTWDGAEFFRGIENESRYRPHKRSSSPTPGDRSDAISEPPLFELSDLPPKSAFSEPTLQEPLSKDLRTGSPPSVNSSSEAGNDLAGIPNQVYKMTVATILRRSQSLAKARRRAAKAAKQQELAQRRQQASQAQSRPGMQRSDTASSRLSTLREESNDAGSSGPPSPSLNSPGSPRTKSTKPLKKPYRIYDSSFSQRIVDPLEPLLEMVARRGEDPDNALGGGAKSGGLIVGIEVEVLESAGLSLDAYTTSTAMPKQSTSSVHSVDMERKRIRRRIVEIRAAPIRKPDGTHLGGMLILRDITDDRATAVISATAEQSQIRQLAGKKLTESGEGYFKQILDHMPQMVWTTTPMGSHDYFNNQWYEYTGLEPEQSLGIGWQNPFHDDDMPHTIKAWSHSLATGDPYSVEYRCRRHDGAWRWMLGRALPMRDAEGKITGWFGSCTDIDDFISMRYQLAKTQEQFRSVMYNAEMVILTMDRYRSVTFLEGIKGDFIPGTAGIRVSDAIGRQFDEIMPFTAEGGLDSKLVAILSGNESVITFEYALSLPAAAGDVSSMYRITLSPLRSEQLDGSTRIDGVIMVANDISAIRNAETELAKVVDERSKLMVSEAAAKEASRMKSEFVSTINHELRTPVSGMIGIAELLLDDSSLSALHRDSIEKIMRSGEILLDMIGMVLDMGKVEAGKLELEQRPFHLADILDDARLVASSTSRKGLKFVDNAHKVYSGPVLGDMPKLRQVLSNLLSNAIKFTSEGAVTLTVVQEEETPEFVRIAFTVEDTGVGIKNENLSHLFGAFQQEDASTSRKFGGTGLGLYISRQLAELMGGSITLVSSHGQGTKATCVVPFTKSQLPIELPAIEEKTRYVDRAKIWILVAEDNDINREIVVRHLQKMKFNVKAVINGLEVLKILREQTFDLILMDGQMPEMDGYAATGEIRARRDLGHQSVKIIALTAAAVEGDKQKCIDAGMDDYLAKPVRAKSLEAMIMRQLVPTPEGSPAPPAPLSAIPA